MTQKRFLLILLPVAACFSQNASWTHKSPSTSPSARDLHALVYDQARAQTMLFGGWPTGGGICLNDTWVWDGNNWTQKFPSASPPPRWQHAMAYDQIRQQVVLFGGFSSTNIYLNDTWVWDGNNWTQKFPSRVPSARVGHSMAYDALHGQVVLFSGSSATGVSDDTWVWDGNNWTQTSPTHRPEARIYFAMAYDHIKQQVVLFGGNQATLSDTWLWTGSDWAQQTPVPTPAARSEQGMAYDPVSGEVMMYGGKVALPTGGYQHTNDTLLWDGYNWTKLSPSNSPPFSGTSTFIVGDESRSQVVLFASTYDSSTDTFLPMTWVWGVVPPSLDTGSLTVSITPTAATAATFSISPTIPGFPSSAPSPVTHTGVLAGHYQITFNNLPGWNTPAPYPFDISPSTNTPVVGSYTPKSGTGSATISVSINNLSGGFTITSTNPAFGGPLTCPGSPSCILNILAPLAVPAGTYTLNFKAVAGTFTPLAQRVTLADGQLVDLAGYYRRLFLVGFTGFNSAPSPSNCPLNHGSGVQYGQAQMSQPGMGIGTAVLSALNNVQLKQATQGTVFTFYDTGNGDACTAPIDESSHTTAGNWLQQQEPSPDDWIVVVGHSYGGSRAQLFANQVQTQLLRPVDLLVTIDPIRWTLCNIEAVVFGSGDAQPCNQTLLLTQPSSARQVWSYYQTLGWHVSGNLYYAIDGFIPLNAVAFKNIPASHTDIVNTGSVQSAITNMLLSAANGPQMAAVVNNTSRSNGLISLSLTVTLQPMVNVSGLTLSAVTLNGVPATNLSLVSNVGNLVVGNSRTATLQFPSTAGVSSSTGLLSVFGQNAVGQAVTFPSLRVTLP
jgi:hypothetical protein